MAKPVQMQHFNGFLIGYPVSMQALLLLLELLVLFLSFKNVIRRMVFDFSRLHPGSLYTVDVLFLVDDMGDD